MNLKNESMVGEGLDALGAMVVTVVERLAMADAATCAVESSERGVPAGLGGGRIHVLWP